MSDFHAYIWVTAGVLIAVVFPVISAKIRKEFPAVAGRRRILPLPPWLTRYLLLLVFSGFVAVIGLAIWRNQNPTVELHWFTAFLIGFGGESAIEKFFRPIR